MYELTVDATIENISVVTDFVNGKLSVLDCPDEARFQIEVAVDEIFGNIARYAYGEKTGKATVRVETDDDPLAVTITFLDSGTPFDPLESDDPELDSYMYEQKIGGFGIYFVKSMMDEMRYRYENGQNILTVKKLLKQN